MTPSTHVRVRRRGGADERDSESLSWVGTRGEEMGVDEWAVTHETVRRRVRVRGIDPATPIEARYHPPLDGAKPGRGAVWVGGAGGGLDGPARGLYPAACRRLQREGVGGLRLHYRYPNELEECVLDTLLGVEFLVTEGTESVALVGHSFGGAVVITAAALSERVRAVVPMSTQTYGTDLAPALAPRPVLLVHGAADSVLPDICSRRVFAAAREPKELKLYPGAGHGLDEVREELLDLLVGWIPAHLQSPA